MSLFSSQNLRATKPEREGERRMRKTNLFANSLRNLRIAYPQTPSS